MQTPKLNIMQSQQAVPSRRLWRVFALVVAMLIAVTLVGCGFWTFSAARNGLQNQTRQGDIPQKSIRAGKLLCSVSYNTNWSIPMGQPPLEWSALGVIASADPFLKTFSAQTCASQSLINLPTTLVRPLWSPDGKRLLLLHGEVADVRDASMGSVMVSFQADRSIDFAQAVWASHGTQIISLGVNVISHNTQSVKVQVWDASTGALVRTVFTFSDGVLIGSAWISPNGKYLALQKSDNRIEFLSINTGKLVSTTSASVAGNGQSIAWSPDDASLAIGLPNANWPTAPSEVQVWSALTGQLTASFQDSHTFEGYIRSLAWSPDGKYLAESSAEIQIWDVATKKLVTTFGKIATKITSSSGKTTTSFPISSVTWAPDSSRLASVTSSYFLTPVPGDTLNVWQLS